MKKCQKRLLRVVVGIVIFIAFIFGGVFLGHKVFFQMPFAANPTVAAVGSGDFQFGAASKQQPTTVSAYVNEVLAQQVKHYNQHIETYWPNNPEKNQYMIAQGIGQKGAYLIAPSGKVSTLSAVQFASYNVSTMDTEGQWMRVKANGIQGADVNVTADGLKNYYSFERYFYLGTYDQFLSYNHELFHSITQESWAQGSLPASERDDRLDDTTARKTRMLLQQQLKQAVADETKRDQYTRAALATYQAYRKNSAADYKNALYFDRIEGSAYYYEITSALYAGYPAEIHSHADVYRAISLIFANDNPAYRFNGAVSESYNVGALAGFLLDLLAIQNKQNPDDWKLTLEKDGNTTPMLLLEKAVTGDLPKAATLPTDQEYKTWYGGYDQLNPDPGVAASLFDLAYNTLYH